MIKMQDDLNKNKIWLTGMILEAREDNISALIRMHDKRIEIFVKSADEQLYPSREYLSVVREYLLIINRELNLTAEDMIVYKENSCSEEISYNLLLIHLSSGQKEYFSPVFRRMISIKKILGLVENENNIDYIIEYCMENQNVTLELMCDSIKNHQNILVRYEEFKNNLLECCTKLQGNTLQIQKGKENDRNTYLRDLLSVNKKYLVSDQTLNGLSANRKNAGELDLLIKDKRQHPFSILEALTLRSVNKKYITDHIEKLFHYDTWGLPYNYLVVYAEVENFASFCQRYKNYISKFQYPYELLEVIEQEVYTEICVFETVLQRNGRETVITHVVVNIQ